MSDRHFAFWPKGLPRHLTIPETDLFYNVEVSARRFPNKPYLVFYDTPISFAEFKDEAERLAGFLEHRCGVRKGDRVLLDRGVTYVEGYGLSETIAPTHINPPDRAKKQCLGIPIFDVDARVVDLQTFKELPPGETGEIVVNGPQVFRGYWNNPHGTADAFVDIDGKRFFRTGDLGRTDEDGYFFMVDRLKRMINASGYKVWPAEVEALMYQHPAIQEACVISARDAHRGETVKCLVALKESYRGKVTEQEIIAWASQNMAAYKYPRLVEFVETLPKSAMTYGATIGTDEMNLEH